MDFPKYDGNIHPDEWINDIQRYCEIWKTESCLYIAISLIDPIVKLPTNINDIENLRNALKEDISFSIFKNTNKRKLQLLKYIPENRGGDTSKFISTFLKLCYNAEINDVEEQKNYLYKSLPMMHFDTISNEFHEKMKNVSSTNELVKEFEDFAIYESNLITSESIIALKHIATGKYLSSIENLCYTTGYKFQLVFAGSPVPGPNSLWKIKFENESVIHSNTFIKLQHVKSINKFLGICGLTKSPSNNHTEVSCNNIGNMNSSYRILWEENWKFNYSKLANHQGHLKSNDIINLSIKKTTDDIGYYTQNGQIEFLRSHDIKFTVKNDTFQEVVCHKERLGGNDEWRIELIKQYVWTMDTLQFAC
ncbi:hypothetical protein RclHR1_04690014 [Rhizophagus clarus]|uniref:MIR domain-containing protein n=1 Tax=Rhizophagus clarus TaxID=94130 RepID=A0A2Z6RNP8_9GLOM|nr:hypothetical protein RclHR1_04690014 [Rhizophagus clarus]GES95032.1 hypothetical protein GLOIN_2v1767369 [Rhizophagus clarus]